MTRSASRSPVFHPFVLTFVALALVLAWDATGLDLVLARLSGTPSGFPLREDWFLVRVMHEDAKILSWVLVIALLAGIRWPVSILRRMTVGERAQLAVTALASVLAVSIIKRMSATSCPWDLQAFGGVAHYVSHWAWGLFDGGPGSCFPAGHASSAFAYVGGYFALRRSSPAVARAWLGIALAAGLLLGVGQQLRGAHYMSHTLWTGWICWAVGFAIDALVRRASAYRASRALSNSLPKLNEF